MAGFLKLMNMSCEKASELASESLDRELTRGERIALRLHELICRSCRLWRRQLQAVQQTLQNAPETYHRQWAKMVLRLSPERRTRIKQLLAEAKQSE
jgi:hypothetical protein